jgi:cytochrome c biogenesis factor
MRTAQVNSSALGISRNVGIRTDWLRAEDLYTILDQVNRNSVFIIVEVEPLVNLVWLAGYLFVVGSLVAMWPDAREQRRLATRLALARA